MSSIRCPTRLDFMNAVKCDDVRELHRSRLGRPSSALRGAARASPRNAMFSMRMSRVTNDGSDSDEEGVPAYLNCTILDAMDRLEECAELKAIVYWLDDLRKRHHKRMRIIDKDLSNGVALLDAMYIIDSTLFNTQTRRANCFLPQLSGEDCYVERDLDEHGHAASRNIQMVRHVLGRYPWREECADDATIQVPNFEHIDEWDLANFVLLAAVTCERCDELVGQMLSFDEWVQQRLSDVVARGMETLGLERPAVNDEADAGGGAKLEGELAEERRKRQECEAQIEALTEALEGWRCTCQGLEEEVVATRARLDDAKAEIRRLRATGRSVLRDCEGRKRDSYNRFRGGVRR